MRAAMEGKRVRDLLVVLVVLGLSPATARAQDARARIGILPVELTGDTLDRDFAARLPERLADALGRRPGVRLEGEAVPAGALRAAAREGGQEGIEAGWIPGPVLEWLFEAEGWDHLLMGRVENRSGELLGDFRLVSPELRVEAEFRVVDVVGAPSALEAEVVDRLVLQLTRSIRIAMLRFPLTGGDTARYQRLERGLPSMLATELSLSPRLVLLESFEQEELVREREESLRGAGIQNRLTALEIGRELQANYYIMGEFWELDGALRVDVRVVGIESGEVVVVRGVSISPPDMETIEDRVARLAADVRSAIERDFLERESRPRYVAAAALPPYPRTAENRALAAALVRDLGRKFKALEGLGVRVREDPSLQSGFMDRRQDRWAMSSALDADLLVSLALDRSDPERLVVDYDIFDTRDPEALRSLTEIFRLDQADELLNGIVGEVVRTQGDTLSGAEREALAGLQFQGIHRGWSWRIRTGLAGRFDHPLFLDSGGGLALDVGPLWIPDRRGRWHVEPLNLRLDLLASKASGDRVVIGGDLMFVTVARRFRPNRTYDPYVGVSFGVLGVFRKGVGDIGYNGKPGAGLVLGVEQLLASARRVTYEIELTTAFWEAGAQVIGGESFSAGRPGGFYLTVGTTF